MGLVNAVVPHEQLDAEVRKWCDEIVEKSPTAIALAKRSFNVDTRNDPWHGLAGDARIEALLRDRLNWQRAATRSGKSGSRISASSSSSGASGRHTRATVWAGPFFAQRRGRSTLGLSGNHEHRITLSRGGPSGNGGHVARRSANAS